MVHGQLPRQFSPAHPWHYNVRQEKVDPIAAFDGRRDRLGAISGLHHLQPEPGTGRGIGRTRKKQGAESVAVASNSA
jgi:hypothetical protein